MGSIARIDGRFATGDRDAIGERERIGAIETERVTADDGGEGQPGAGLIDSPELPAASQPAEEA